MAGTVKLEKLGLPGVFMNCDTFDDDALSAAADNEMPRVRRVKISSAEFYKLRGSVDTIRPLVEEHFDEFVDALIVPLTGEEENPPPVKSDTDGPPRITVLGDSYEEAVEAFNKDFLSREWGDGLPLVPPTDERVKWMLSGTKRSPDEVLGTINPKGGTVTIEKIAINSVMAGAKPEYMPVIISVIESLADDKFDDLHVLASAGSFGLLIVVSGPIAKELEMNAGIGFMGHGNRANNTIGRAVRLTTLNIGRTWPAKNDMALIGRLSPHTFFTFSENTALSPWQSYHVNRGFPAEQSCVTVASIHGSGPLQHFYGGMIMTWTADSVLDNLVDDLMRTNRRTLRLWGGKGVGLVPGSGNGANNHMIILFPELVAEYKKMGYDQAKLQDEIYRRVSVPYEELIKKVKINLQNIFSQLWKDKIKIQKEEIRCLDSRKVDSMLVAQQGQDWWQDFNHTIKLINNECEKIV